MFKTINGTSPKVIKRWISVVKKDIQRNDFWIDGKDYFIFFANLRTLNYILPAKIFFKVESPVDEFCKRPTPRMHGDMGDKEKKELELQVSFIKKYIKNLEAII